MHDEAAGSAAVSASPHGEEAGNGNESQDLDDALQNSLGVSCERCRQMHKKCDKSGPPCSRCRLSNENCVYVGKPPGRPSRKISAPHTGGMRFDPSSSFTIKNSAVRSGGNGSSRQESSRLFDQQQYSTFFTPFEPLHQLNASGPFDGQRKILHLATSEEDGDKKFGIGDADVALAKRAADQMMSMYSATHPSALGMHLGMGMQFPLPGTGMLSSGNIPNSSVFGVLNSNTSHGGTPGSLPQQQQQQQQQQQDPSGQMQAVNLSSSTSTSAPTANSSSYGSHANGIATGTWPFLPQAAFGQYPQAAAFHQIFSQNGGFLPNAAFPDMSMGMGMGMNLNGTSPMALLQNHSSTMPIAPAVSRPGVLNLATYVRPPLQDSQSSGLGGPKVSNLSQSNSIVVAPWTVPSNNQTSDGGDAAQNLLDPASSSLAARATHDSEARKCWMAMGILQSAFQTRLSSIPLQNLVELSKLLESACKSVTCLPNQEQEATATPSSQST
eukprot:ANDGO_02627.mRNA.1 hypothetical protein